MGLLLRVACLSRWVGCGVCRGVSVCCVCVWVCGHAGGGLCGALECSEVRCSTVECSGVRCSEVQYSGVQGAAGLSGAAVEHLHLMFWLGVGEGLVWVGCLIERVSIVGDCVDCVDCAGCVDCIVRLC